ncbi:MAG: amino acid permease [Planctomycetota bacterium]
MDIFRRKSVSQVIPEESHAGGLKRSLGAIDLVMLGIGAIIGAGLFSSIADMISGTTYGENQTLGAGPAVMVSYLLTAIACGFAALCYAEIAAMVPVSGSAYSYSYVAFGEVIAWIIGWDLIVEYAIGNIYVAQKWGTYFQTFLNGVFDIQIPVWLTMDFQSARALVAEKAELASQFPSISGHILSFNLPAFSITILLTILLFIGVKESARATAVMVVLKVALVLAFISIGFFHVDTNNWTPYAPNGFTGIWHGAALGFFSYIGFDAVSTAGEETRNPQKNLPRGMIWSLLICTVLYILTAAVLTGVLSTAEIKEHAGDPLAYMFTKIGMPGASNAFAFGAIVAMAAVLLVFQLGQTRIFMVMSRDGLLPKMFSKIHPKHRTPYIGTWVAGLFVALMCSVLTPAQAIGLCNIGTLFAFILVSVGVIALRIREPNRHRPFKVPGYPFTPIISALACLALILGLEQSNWLRFIGWLGIGLVVYFAYGYRRSVLNKVNNGTG